MANLFSLKIKQPFFLWLIIFCCLLPFVILMFFSCMALDDYYFVNLYHTYSFGKVQIMTYFGWDGRYISTLLKGVFVKPDIVSHYYFIPILLLFFFTWLSFFLLLRTINKYLLTGTFSKSIIRQASFILFLVEIYTIADIGSGLYWFSSAIVYQPALICFALLMNCLLRRLCEPSSRNIFLIDIAAIILILTILGCNEIAAIFLILFLLFIAIFYYLYNRRTSTILLIYLGIAVAISILTTLTSGVIAVRHNQMNSHTSYLTVIPIIFFRATAVFYYILKEPLFWITALMSLIAGVKTGQITGTANVLNIFKGKRILAPGLLIIVLLIAGTLTPVLMVSKGSLPPRSLNNLISFIDLCLLVVFFLTGFSSKVPGKVFMYMNRFSSVTIILLICGLLASTSYLESWKSVVSGYFYHAVIEDRQALLLKAKENNQRVVAIKPYPAALQEKIHQVFPHGTFVTVNKILLEPPRALFYINEAENPSKSYLDYYGLDSIIVEKRGKND